MSGDSQAGRRTSAKSVDCRNSGRSFRRNGKNCAAAGGVDEETGRKDLNRSVVPIWSAVTCHRFSRSRLVATFCVYAPFLKTCRRQAAADQSADRSAHSKSILLFFFHRIQQIGNYQPLAIVLLPNPENSYHSQRTVGSASFFSIR